MNDLILVGIINFNCTVNDLVLAMAGPVVKLTSGYNFPLVGLGTFTLANKNDVETSLNTALEAGYRHIDTANLYQNEQIIGRVLKQWFDSGKLKRSDLFVTTKLPLAGVHPDKVEEYIKLSLEKLQFDYIDLYLIHTPIYDSNGPQPTDHIAVWKKLEEQVELGRTRAIGVSNFNKDQVKKIVDVAKIKPAANQVELHIYLQQPELVKYLQENGIIPISYFSLGNQGIGEILKKRGWPQSTKKQPALMEDPVIVEIATKYGKSPAQILLKFLIQKEIAIIPKSVTPQRIKDNFDLFDFSLSSEDMATISALDRGEEGRRNCMLRPGYVDHPEYPFPRIPRD